MKLKIHHIDAFTDKVFKGNYAAVITLEEWLSDDLMDDDVVILGQAVQYLEGYIEV